MRATIETMTSPVRTSGNKAGKRCHFATAVASMPKQVGAPDGENAGSRSDNLSGADTLRSDQAARHPVADWRH